MIQGNAYESGFKQQAISNIGNRIITIYKNNILSEK